MYVVATAGHVDHGKSTLVRALTGMEPDRWAEERRRGMTIDLGYAWLTLPDGQQLAFVDVPGHERFVPNMLAGLGPVPAVLFVVAADGGWMPQSAEHLAAVDALGVRHGLLVVTRADLADPGPATSAALAEIARTSLGTVEAIAVSAVTGQGIDDLRAALTRLVSSLPPAAGVASPVRLWIDRSFTIRGAGTVVTGTLPAGTVRNGQELLLTPSAERVRVRGLEALGEPANEVTGVARVALNLRGVPAGLPARGMALTEPGRWTLTSELDVRVIPGAAGLPAKFPPELLLHIGSARTQAKLRLLGEAPLAGPPPIPPAAVPAASETSGASFTPIPAPVGRVAPVGPVGPVGRRGASEGPVGPVGPVGRRGASEGPVGPVGRPDGRVAVYARLRLREPLPLHVGDRVLLRDPGAAELAIFGATVLDLAPPPLARRGAGAAAVRELAGWPDRPGAADLLRRHKLLRVGQLTAAGVTDLPEPVAGEWLADPAHWAWLRAELPKVVAAFTAKDPLAQGMTTEAARAALRLPSRDLVTALARDPVVLDGGYLRIFTTHAPDIGTEDATADPGTQVGPGRATGPGTAGSSGVAVSPATAPGIPGDAGAPGTLGAPVVPGTSSTSGVTAARAVTPGTSGTTTSAPAVQLPPRIAAAVQQVLDDLAADPFGAPDTERLRELGLDAKALAAAARGGLLLRIADLVVLAPGADKEAASVLGALDQPFTTSQARQALRTSRRVAIPLLEYLDRARVTERLPGDLRRLRSR